MQTRPIFFAGVNLSLNLVTVTWTEQDFTQAGAVGSITFAPNANLTDATDGLMIGQQSKTYHFVNGAGTSDPLVATDNSNLLPSGWTYVVTVSVNGTTPYSFNCFIAFANGASQKLSSLVPAVPVPALVSSLPLPAGTATAGYVPVATGSGEASVWASPGSASLPLTTLGDTLYENATPTPARLPGNTSAVKQFLTQTGTGTVSAAPAWAAIAAGDVPDLAYVDSVTAADGSVVVGGAADAPTVRTGTLDAIATAHPPTAAVGLNGQKITGLANGSASSDAAAYGQTPAGGATVTIAEGGTGQTTQQAALDAVAGAVTANEVLAGNGTHVTLRALAAGDIPALPESQITGLVADLAARLLLSGGTMTGSLTPAVAALTDGVTISLDASKGNLFRVTLGGNRTLANPTNPTDGQLIRVEVTQDATGSRTLSYGTAYDFGATGVPTLSTVAGKIDVLGFSYNATAGKWDCLAFALGY